MVSQKLRERNIHTVRVKGVPASVSDQTGALVLFGKREYQGHRIKLQGKGLLGVYDPPKHATFQPRMVEGKMRTVAVFNRLPPGDYYSCDNHHFGMSWLDVSITTNWAQEEYC